MSKLALFGNPRIEPFKVAVAESVLTDLRERLAATRWPNEAVGAPWLYGASLAWMREVRDHWLHRYDWRAQEAALNRWPHFRAKLGGGAHPKRLHFICEQGSGPDPLVLILSHGWPGSVAEFLQVIDPLAHPERFGGDVRDAFTVIVPSLPGYGFSDPPDEPIAHREIAASWHELMTEVLGCERYAAQAGDVGAGVVSWLALDHPEELAAIHLTMMSLQPEIDADSPPVTEAEKAWMKETRRRTDGNMGYVKIQGSKHQTLAYGLTDLPIGLAAWILEKFQGWTISDSDQPPPFPLDDLITNVMLHWLQGPNAPMWTYRFFQSAARRVPKGRRIEVPTGMLFGPNDMAAGPPDSWIERTCNLVHRRDAEAGGHFLAFERPDIFVEDVRGFFRRFRG